jgi:heme-degrading monooxygenase HmoA
MPDRVRVLVWYRAPDGDVTAVESAYRQVTAELEGTRGLITSELLHARGDQESLVVMSEWESRAMFEEWEIGAGHRGTTAGLRRFSDHRWGRPFEVYDVRAGD